MGKSLSIGLAVTTRNREVTAKETITKIREHAPKGAKIVIVDDASDKPFEGADFRFEQQAGIAKAKNKCFELLEDCEHIFLFDDDCWPKSKDWHLPYVNSKYNHLMYIFAEFSNGKPNGNRKVTEIDDASIYENPCGCMLYYKRICLEKVGGMDPEYGIWGWDHVDLSVRIYNAGLTPHKFMDVKNSDDLFFSHDKQQTIQRSVPTAIRAQHIAKNKRKFQLLGKSAKFIPYKEKNGIILTSYFTGEIDPQRGEKWDVDINQLKPLIESAKANNSTIYVIHDCFDEASIADVVKNYDKAYFMSIAPQNENPYFFRWKSYKNILNWIKKEFTDNVWIVDATDVLVLKNPFQLIEDNVLYCGWEKDFIGCQWMLNHHKSNFMQNFIKSNIKTPLLNAGVVGGRYDIVMEFLDRLCDMYEILPEKEACVTDMPLFNWTIYSHFLNRFITGPTITTQFKKYDINNKFALFAHK